MLPPVYEYVQPLPVPTLAIGYLKPNRAARRRMRIKQTNGDLAEWAK